MNLLTRFSIATGLIWIIIGTADNLVAAELQIEDHNRLIRVLADVKTSQKIEVQLSAEPQSFSLEHLDGLQQKRQAVNLGDRRFVFDGVDPGSWRLRVRPRTIAVLKVTISEE